MKTLFRAEEKYSRILRRCAEEFRCDSPARPERFMKVMAHNRGCISMMLGGKKDPDGLEWKNPVIVVLGDSVTAGHFESLLPSDENKRRELMEEAGKMLQRGELLPPIEVTDARECYPERFRSRLIDKYEQTSVSVINAGIAGDNLKGMADRLDRDVIRYQPDLVIINGALNWDPQLGGAEDYKQLLTSVVWRIKANTEADIILLTPNGDLPGDVFGGAAPAETGTEQRVQKIREVAREQRVCLADVHRVWEMAKERGCPWDKLLANGINHPGVEGHEVYAMVLMKLLEVRK